MVFVWLIDARSSFALLFDCSVEGAWKREGGRGRSGEYVLPACTMSCCRLGGCEAGRAGVSG